MCTVWRYSSFITDDGYRDAPLKAVQIDALVVMKVVKTCSQKFPTQATGSLVGMDNNGTLEITNCFPFPIVEIPNDSYHDGPNPNAAAAAPRAKANAAFQNEMIRMLKEVNIDAQNVGWYTSSSMGNFITSHFIDNQVYYQSQPNERSIALVHDVSRSSQGALSLRAYRLSPQFFAAYKEKDKEQFTVEK